MGDIFNIGISGLVSFQRSLGTVSNNIVNANTEGYSRQDTLLTTGPSNFIGGTYFGTGVTISGTRRITDEFFNDTLRTNISTASQYETLLDKAGQIDSLLADSATGLSQALESFFAAVDEVNNDPASIPARQVMLTQSEILVERFQRLDAQLVTMSKNVDEQYDEIALSINALAGGIATLNNNIVQSQGVANGNPPNELLDQRDSLINDLSELASVTTIKTNDGTVNVLLGTGESLVVRTTVNTINSRDSLEDSFKKELTVSIGSSSSIVNMDGIGGELQGLHEFRENILEPARNGLGLIAVGIAEIFNAQHLSGMDLNGTLGVNYFNDITSGSAIVNGSNNGTGNIATTITDVTNLKVSDYLVEFNGNYNITRLSDGVSVGSFPPGTTNIASEGFSITTSGTTVLGDTFIISPLRTKSQEMRVSLTDPKLIAAASPIRTSTDAGNHGTGTINQGDVTDVTGAEFTTTAGALSPPVLIHFLTPTTYELHDNTGAPLPDPPLVGTRLAGPLAFTPNSTNQMIPVGLGYGYQIEVAGAPHASDRFTIDYNTGGVSDNRNILKLAAFQDSALLNTGTTTFRQAYGQVVADVGNRTREAGITQSASETLLRQSLERRDSVSGVNLDEEGAKLLQFQNAFQAAAQIINAAASILEELIAATR